MLAMLFRMQFSSHLLVYMSLFVFCLADTDIQMMLKASKCGGKEKASSLLDFTRDSINKAKDLYPNCSDDDCGQKEKSSAFLDVAMNVISELKKHYPSCPDPECPKPVERPMDCLEILRSGKNESGNYTIWPRNRITTNKALAVYCDMDTEGGGWTVIQRRGNFSTPKDYFYKDWESYKKGFGNIAEEFWIGNDNIYAISNQANYSIRFDLEDAKGNTGYAIYNTFWIDEEDANYTLHIKGYSGNVGDAMNDKMQFSTKDRKNDRWTVSCAVDRQGAWWYNACHGAANLNGLYQPGVVSEKGAIWSKWTKTDAGLSAVEIKLRPSL